MKRLITLCLLTCVLLSGCTKPEDEDAYTDEEYSFSSSEATAGKYWSSDLQEYVDYPVITGDTDIDWLICGDYEDYELPNLEFVMVDEFEWKEAEDGYICVMNAVECLGSSTVYVAVVPEMYNNRPVIGIEDGRRASYVPEVIVLPDSIQEGYSYDASWDFNGVYCRFIYQGAIYTRNDAWFAFKAGVLPQYDADGFLIQDTTLIRAQDDALFKQDNDSGALVVPEGVTVINDYAFFEYDSADEVILPSTVESIGALAFKHSEISAVNLPDGLVSIGQSAFQDSEFACEFVIPNTVTEIGSFAFDDPGKCNVTKLSANLQDIGFDVFQYVELDSSITVPGTLVRDDGSWWGRGVKGVTDVVWEDGIVSVGYGLDSLPESVERVTLPSTLEILDLSTFNSTAVTIVEIPDSVTRIDTVYFKPESVPDIKFVYKGVTYTADQHESLYNAV